MKISGKFDVALTPAAFYAQGEKNINLSRMSIDKTFYGDLEASSKGEMLSAGTATKGSAGYVAIEQVTGTLSGRTGAFVLQHFGIMNSQMDDRLILEVVPDSGSGGLEGLTGTMKITMADGQHYYDFDYESASKKTSNSAPSQQQTQELISLFERNLFEAVLSKAEPLARLYPQSVLLLNLLGSANAALLNYDAAIDSYKKALHINPNYADIYNNMGNVFKDKGQMDAALESYQKALDINPNCPGAHNNIDIVLNAKGQMDATINSLKQALINKFDDAEACYKIGVSLFEKGDLDAAIDGFKQALNINPNYAEAHYNMANVLSNQRKFDDAIASYQQLISLRPDFAEAHYHMANALKAQSKLGQAIMAYKEVLTLKPDFSEARHLLASLTGETTNSAPRAYVEKLFDGYASNFDLSLIDNLEYKIPTIITEMILKRHLGGTLGSILDLGCGTGLFGMEIKEHCTKLEGIDLSNAMLEQARNKNIYDKLTHSDILDFLSTEDLSFDYFISTDVFVYIGDLSDVFRLIKSRNRSGGKLVFSTEDTHKDGFYLEKSGRYSHSRAYIESLCNKFNYKLSHFETKNLRKDKDQFITGGLYLLDF